MIASVMKNAGHEIILVSSGAIGMGVGKLSLSARPKDMPTKQAAAAIGQCELMYFYDKLFSEYNHIVAQLLITAPDLAEGGSRKAHFHNTLARLLELGALPVINENDTVSTDEIVIGDNDTLSAIVSATVSADLLILLSDIDGLYDRMPSLLRPSRSSTRVFSRSRATKARSSPPAAWSPSCTRRRSRRLPAARWSLQTAKNRKCSMISSAASASAQDS